MNTNWVNNAACYTAERTILTFTQVTQTVSLTTLVIGGTTISVSATYIARNRTLNIDISDFVRMGSGYADFQEGTSTAIRIRWSSVQGANPVNLIAPWSPYQRAVEEYLQTGANSAFGLPSVMIAPSDGENDISAVIYAPDMTNISAKVDGSSATISSHTLAIRHDSKVVEVFYNSDKVLDIVRLVQQECGKTYAEVAWESRTGEGKTHYFEVSAIKVSKENDTELQDYDVTGVYGYRVQCGETLSATLRLPNVSAYDIWYYSDILKSNPSVLINGARYQAAVNTKSLDASLSTVDTYDLEIDVTLAKFEPQS